MRLLATVVCLWAVPTAAFAHTSLLSPTPRPDMANYQTIAPCGGLPHSDVISYYHPGDQVNVQWVETIEHPGYFRISFRTSDTGDFTQDVIANNIPAVPGTDNYNDTITLPATPCASCTLQLVQVQTGTTNNTTPSGNIEYVACADIVLDANATVTTGGTGTGTTGGGTTTGGATGGGATTGGGPTLGSDSNTTTSVTSGPGAGSTGGCMQVSPAIPWLAAVMVFGVWRWLRSA